MTWFLGQPLGVEEKLTITLGYLAILVIAVLKRLTAPQTSVTVSVSTGQLLVNRLLFDRDIRDREAWIHRKMKCATHPQVETNLRCGKCGKLICPKCMIQTPVGARCLDCARLYKLPTYQVSTKYYLRAILA